MELLNEDKDSDHFNRKLKHKKRNTDHRKHMKISFDDEENNMHIENNKNNLDNSYIPQDLSILTNEFKEIWKKSGLVPDTLSK
jgi:hypothetical protein